MYSKKRVKKRIVIPPLSNPQPIFNGVTAVILEERMSQERREVLEKRVQECGGRCVPREDIRELKVTHCIYDSDMPFASLLKILRSEAGDLYRFRDVVNFIAIVKCKWLTESLQMMHRAAVATYSRNEELKVRIVFGIWIFTNV
jgi:hypothetical protein